MKKPLTKKQELVLTVIEGNPGVQDDEMKLLEAVWRYENWDDTKSLYWNLTRVTHPETISRARRFLHEHGRIKYSDEADTRRYTQYIEMTNEYGERVMKAL